MREKQPTILSLITYEISISTPGLHFICQQDYANHVIVVNERLETVNFVNLGTLDDNNSILLSQNPQLI